MWGLVSPLPHRQKSPGFDSYSFRSLSPREDSVNQSEMCVVCVSVCVCVLVPVLRSSVSKSEVGCVCERVCLSMCVCEHVCAGACPPEDPRGGVWCPALSLPASFP